MTWPDQRSQSRKRPRHSQTPITSIEGHSQTFESARSVIAADRHQFHSWGGTARTQEEQPDDNHVILGVGTTLPAYQDAKGYRVLSVLVVDIEWRRLFAYLGNSVGADPIYIEHVTIGASAAYVPGHRGKYAPDGIRKLSAGVGACGFAKLKFGRVGATLGAANGISGGTEELVANASFSYVVRAVSRSILIPTIGGSWAETKHNDGYFGIDTIQSGPSGLPALQAKSGLKDGSALLNVGYRLTDRCTLVGLGRHNHAGRKCEGEPDKVSRDAAAWFPFVVLSASRHIGRPLTCSKSSFWPEPSRAFDRQVPFKISRRTLLRGFKPK